MTANRANGNGWPRSALRPAPPMKTGPGLSKKADRELYDACHKAWRAGLIDSWYFGKRSPSDPTIVWEVNGIEGAPTTIASQLTAHLQTAGVASLTWEPTFCGYRGLAITYTNGQTATEQWDGATNSVTITEEHAA